MDNHKVLSELYITYTNEEPQNIEELPSSGSNRRYFRLSGKQSLIGVIGTCKEENEAFLYMDAHFISKGLPVPKVLLHSEDKMAYIQEDLGDTLLFNAIEKGRKTTVFSEEERFCFQKLSACSRISNLPEQTGWISQNVIRHLNSMRVQYYGI